MQIRIRTRRKWELCRLEQHFHVLFRTVLNQFAQCAILLLQQRTEGVELDLWLREYCQSRPR